MNGLKVNGITLFLGYIPTRKSLCFYFEKGSTLYPVAYIKKELSGTAVARWREMLGETNQEKEN